VHAVCKTGNNAVWRDEKATRDLRLGSCIALGLPQVASGQQGLEKVPRCDWQGDVSASP